MIQLKGISKVYRLGLVRVEALKSVDLEIRQGEFAAITGPSGSGKSTLLHLLGLLDRPSGGTYLFDGREISSLSDDERTALRSRAIGFVFQQFSLLPRTTAEQNVALPLMYSGRRSGIHRARSLLDDVGLSDRRHHFPNQLSGGQQQRVAIARSLVNKPKIILADEPTGNLDSSARDEILSIFERLHRNGFTLIIVTHEEEVSRRADRIIRMKDGHIVEDKKNNLSAVIARSAEGATPLDQAPVGRLDQRHRTVGSAKQSDKDVAARAQSARSSLRSETEIATTPSESRDASRTALPLTGLAMTEIAGLTWNEIADHFRQALIMLKAHRMRSFLSMLGVMIGVACLISMLSIGEGAKAQIAEELSSLGSNLLSVRPGSGSVRGSVRMMVGEVARFTMDDLAAIREKISGIRAVSGYVGKYSRITYKSKNWKTEVTGVSTEYIDMLSLEPTIGRRFTREEDLRRERVALLGPTVYRELFGSEDPVGKTIRIDRLEFQVLGVLAEKGGSSFRDRDDVLLVPLYTALSRLKGTRYLDQIQVEAATSDDIYHVMESLKELLKRRHRIKTSDENAEAFYVRNMADIQEAMSQSTRIFSTLLGAVAAVSLLVGGIGIMNVMLVSVTERTREIGIRKAVGARNRDVLSQFLVESTVLSGVGGISGVILGILVSWAIAAAADWPVLISVQSNFLGFLFSALLGIGFGVWPAYRASRLDPIESLRYE
ncbi:MAG: ABC transporter permease [Candidatus Omnitrophica bacterium]|nr:ABC transporter permease [Candidatus Omnitrophota bacterium]